MSLDDKRYEGFTNFFTFAVWVWLFKDKDLYGEAFALCSPHRGGRGELTHVERFKRWVEEKVWSTEVSPLQSSLIRGALDGVDWQQLYDHIYDHIATNQRARNR